MKQLQPASQELPSLLLETQSGELTVCSDKHRGRLADVTGSFLSQVEADDMFYDSKLPFH